MRDVRVAFTIPGWVFEALTVYAALAPLAVLVSALVFGRRHANRSVLDTIRLRVTDWHTLLLLAAWPLMAYFAMQDVRRYGWRRRRSA